MEMVLFLRGHYDYWNNSIGVGYDMRVQLWTNGMLPDSESLVPEPAMMSLIALTPLLLARRRRRSL
jgi:hypothetical protein